MTRFITLLLACAAAASTHCVTVEAHTNMAVPVVKWPDAFYNGNSPYGRINSESFTSPAYTGTYGGDKLLKVMEVNGYKTLRQVIMENVNLTTIEDHKASKECGLTITTGDKQPLPDAVDFPWGHPGPCEVWCDNTRIFYNDDCQANNVGKVAVDKTKCAGVNLIQAMYVGVHVSNWEIYSNCAPIVGGTKTDPAVVFNTAATGSGTSDASNSDSKTTETPSLTPATAATTTKPTATAATTPKPTSTTISPSTPSPVASSAAPAADKTTSAPKPSCQRRRL